MIQHVVVKNTYKYYCSAVLPRGWRKVTRLEAVAALT
jgi:hypothetical protein